MKKLWKKGLVFCIMGMMIFSLGACSSKTKKTNPPQTKEETNQKDAAAVDNKKKEETDKKDADKKDKTAKKDETQKPADEKPDTQTSAQKPDAQTSAQKTADDNADQKADKVKDAPKSTKDKK